MNAGRSSYLVSAYVNLPLLSREFFYAYQSNDRDMQRRCLNRTFGNLLLWEETNAMILKHFTLKFVIVSRFFKKASKDTI